MPLSSKQKGDFMSIQTSENTAEEIAKEYHQRGYTKLSGLFSVDEIAGWQAECDRLQKLDLVNPLNKRTPFKNPEIPYPEKIDPVIDISPLFSKLIKDERLVSVVQAIFDDAPLLFKDKLIYKLPGMTGYAMHQDWAHGWQHLAPAEDLLSVSFQIDGADAANGCIELFEGYHEKLLITPGEERAFNESEKAMIDPARGEKMETKAGDVLIFSSLTPHQSGKNLADYPRRSLYLTFNAARAGELREVYYDHYMNEMMGRRNMKDGYFK
jgi:ectoine hydroxylase-related dioxygenase (phytanoyl-CoA dioxygenase family)